jgi:transposase InsO family protein
MIILYGCVFIQVKAKDQVCVEFVKFKAQVENSCGCRVKTVQSNRSGEFQSAPFTKMCEQARIARHLTTPYTPQQNDMVERRNRSVMEMARALLKIMNMPRKF